LTFADSNFLDCLSIMTLGKSKPKYTWQSLTIWILMVLNNLIKNRFTGKSKDLRSDFFVVCSAATVQSKTAKRFQSRTANPPV